MTDAQALPPSAPEADWPIRPIGGRRAFEEILAQLEEALAAGHLSAGERLPSERELAERFAVSRASVREALRVLEALRLLEIRRGPDHGAILRAEPGDALTHLFRFHVALAHYELDQVIDLRATLESAAAAELARHGSEEVFRQLRTIVERMREDSIDPEAFHALDLDFHSVLNDACDNELATLVLLGCRGVIQRYLHAATLQIENWEHVRSSYAEEHRRILDAVEAGSPELAADKMRAHIENWKARTVAATQDGTNRSSP